MPQYLTLPQYFCGEAYTSEKMVRENSSLQHFGQVRFCTRSAKFLLLKLKKEEGKESETALAAGSPLPWLMFAWEQEDISGA